MSTTGDGGTSSMRPPSVDPGGPDGSNGHTGGGRTFPISVVVVAVVLGLTLVGAGTIVAVLLATDAGDSGAPESDDEATADDGPTDDETDDDPAATSQRHPDGDVAIFLCDGRACPEITGEDQQALEAWLDAHDLIAQIHFESKAEAYTRFLEMFEDRPDYIEATDEDDLPASFRVWLDDPDRAGDVAAEVRDHPGVDQVVVNAGRPSGQFDAAPPPLDDQAIAEAVDSLEMAIVFLCTGRRCPEPTDDERAQLETDLETHPDVREVVFESQEDAYERALELLEDGSGLTDELDPSMLPASYHVWVEHPEAYFEDPQRFADFAEGFATYPGVERIVDPMAELRRRVGG